VSDYSEFQDGWSTVLLKDICDRITKGSTPTSYGYKYQDEGIRFIKAENIDIEGIASTTTSYINDETHEFLKRSILQNDDLLFSIAGTIGRVGRVRKIDLPANTNQALAIIRLKPGVIYQKYLFYYLKSDAIQKESLQKIVGVGRANLSLTSIGEFEIPIAPLDQQKRIVAEIEKQFSRLDEAVANLKRVKANLKRYKAAVLKAAVEGKLTEGSWKPISRAIEEIGQGWSPKCDREPSENVNIWGVIKTTAVQHGSYLEDENKRLPEKLEPRPKLEIVAGDILMTRAGPRKRVGVACLVRKTRPKLMACDKVYRLRCKQAVTIPEYLELVLNLPQILHSLDELKTGISDSGVNLTQGRFLALEIPLPEIKIQERIVAVTERKLSILAGLEKEFDASLRRANRLRQSILKKAFSGQLVSNQ